MQGSTLQLAAVSCIHIRKPVVQSVVQPCGALCQLPSALRDTLGPFPDRLCEELDDALLEVPLDVGVDGAIWIQDAAGDQRVQIAFRPRGCVGNTRQERRAII